MRQTRVLVALPLILLYACTPRLNLVQSQSKATEETGGLQPDDINFEAKSRLRWIEYLRGKGALSDKEYTEYRAESLAQMSPELRPYRERDTIEAYQDFLARFPNANEAEKALATNRIASLKTQREQEAAERSMRELQEAAATKQLRSFETKVRRLGIADSPKELYFQVVARERSLQRDEFETSAAHVQRAAEGWVAPIFGTRTLDDLYAFRVESAEVVFDADRGVMDVSISAKQQIGLLASDVRTLKLHADLWAGRRYVGENAFGAIRSVEKLYSDEYQLQLASQAFATPFKFEETMGADEARRAKANLGVIVICRLTSPFVSHDGFLKKPTFESPTEMAFMMYRLVGRVDQVWLVDFGRREVLERTLLANPSISSRSTQAGDQ